MAAKPVAIVTGANVGIGYHCAGSLARDGYQVVLACRSKPKAEKAVEEMKCEYGANISVSVGSLDLSSFKSTRAFAAQFAKSYPKLNVLVCNGGVSPSSISHEAKDQLTADGVDLLYQTNFLSHVLLTLELLPLLQASKGRVIKIASGMHRKCDVKELEMTRKVREPYTSLYGFSKLAPISINEELYRRFGASGVSFHCVNPGGTASDIWRAYPCWKRTLFNCMLASAKSAGSTVAEASVNPEGKAVPGSLPSYWNGYKCASCNDTFETWSPFGAAGRTLVPSTPAPHAKEPAFCSKLWEESIAAMQAAGIPVSKDGVVEGGLKQVSDDGPNDHIVGA